MLPENFTAIVARNERWTAAAASEPYEAGWAREAVFFIRALADPEGDQPKVRVEISPDGMRWVDEGSHAPMPGIREALTVLRVRHFGNWLRVAADFPPGAQSVVLVTLHLKA